MQKQQFENNIARFLSCYDYDVTKTGNARWIDQKCTCDVLSFVTNCILEYADPDSSPFSIKDIWESSYARQNIQMFSKPNVDLDLAKHEYDKFFSQPINLLCYSGMLLAEKDGNKNVFTISNPLSLDILENVATNDWNALIFLQFYIEKVLRDSGVWHIFEIFLKSQNKDEFFQLKDAFTQFTIKNTRINGETECGRIFTKVLNPLAFKYKTRGTERGKLSTNIITLDDLKYNRMNWFDELSGKDKNLTRQEYSWSGGYDYSESESSNYEIQKAKQRVKRYNSRFNKGYSEVKRGEFANIPVHIHHIFPSAEFPSLRCCEENLIAITPNQHYAEAHLGNHTDRVDKVFQYICLIAKTRTIMENDRQHKTSTYDFRAFCYVLNVGLNTNVFDLTHDDLIRDADYLSLIFRIHDFFLEYL
ncbi:restriction endonuclease [Helicobacter suis]|uniref:restriction endonuclease n=1 Tax=Helicobacter suis TaxID=104628 RepID=UPI0013D8B02A|nr:restriction endonuclease [Helicobacter suis]